MEMRQAIRNMKLDPKIFKDDIAKSFNSAGQLLSNHENGIGLLIHLDHDDESIDELEKVQFKT